MSLIVEMASRSTAPTPVVFENGTVLGSMSCEHSHAKVQFLGNQSQFVVPEIVISFSQSSNSIYNNRSPCDVSSSSAINRISPTINRNEPSGEHTSLLEIHQREGEEESEFEQFVLNRTSSESNILESSTCNELQMSNSLCVQAATLSLQNRALDMLNTSACSRSDSESRQGKRMRRKADKAKINCSTNALGSPTPTVPSVADVLRPPQYTAIFLDRHHGNSGVTANAQLTGPVISSPFLSGNPGQGTGSDAVNFIEYHQYCQQRPGMGNVALGHHHHLHHPRRSLFEVAVPLAGSSVEVSNTLVRTNINMSGTVESSENLAVSCLRKWFARPSLPFVIGIFALGGVACTLGGIVLGSTGLIEHSTQYLSAALLMIGIGVSLLVISGAIWRLSLPDDVDDCPCFRRMETCRNCNSPHCNNRLLPGSYLYPEFQHRQPPPSYLTSLNEYAFIYHHSAHPAAAAAAAAYATLGLNTPPPLYRSTYSLNTSASVGTPTPLQLPQTSEHASEEHHPVLLIREAPSQTSFKEVEIEDMREAGPLMRGIEMQTLYKEAELD
ncbi:uncharacterized protein LOC117891997 [Drosophila subobscura]|uniref:uncharacterized protein LOC117891997 n=1 Tax=Drosophila subobscura TaxID=7241 RepID=UPI00155B27D5|nr:uncharacterized protein LOC117891997 [Drosophila subobscura]